jgi:hypothetical protein
MMKGTHPDIDQRLRKNARPGSRGKNEAERCVSCAVRDESMFHLLRGVKSENGDLFSLNEKTG